MITLKFAEINISISTISPQLELEVPPIYKQFIIDDQAQIKITVDYSEPPVYSSLIPVFQSGGNWDLFKQDGYWIIPISFPPGTKPKLVAKFSRDYHDGELFLDKNHIDNVSSYPLAYPLDELLMINVLSRKQGIEMHACAIGFTESHTGFLFAGMSGAGKSTLTRLWQKREGITILSDDRVILRKKQDGYWLYGTPWHGDALGASSCAVPLEKIFILKQSPRNELKPLDPVNAITQLLARCFPTFWDAEGMANSLKLFDELSQTIPCFEFSFLPDQSAIEYILDNLVS